ncbi:MAG: dephospho-CoA kinase [Rhodospirillales bacterium]|nr:dephospho-CoA kinase [Rhodospirillales bacterium]
MFILGLTGSIGMGKTVAAGDFRRLGIPVHDSDATVHALMAKGGAAVSPVSQAFSGVLKDGAIDRRALGRRVFGDDAALKRLEAILHPMVRQQSHKFLGIHARRRTPAVVLDIPLLFESGGERRCDAVAVVSAPYREQRRRVLSRPGMTEERFQEILKHQIPDDLKRRAADFVIFTGLGRAHSLLMIRQIAKIICSSEGRHWPPQKRSRG